MNSICGIFNFDKTPVASSSSHKMLNALKISADDRASVSQKDYFALGNITPAESLAKTIESYSNIETSGNITVTGVSQIYNKTELVKKLSLSGLVNEISNNLLFLKCFEKWQSNCFDQIIGEWLFVLWNDDNKELYIACSHYWRPNLYYYKSANAFYFASSLKALLALDEVPQKINEFRLGQLIIGWNNNLGNTFYKDIYPLKPAHFLKISADTFQEKRYWALEKMPVIRFKTDNDYVDCFRELYTEVVKNRIDVSCKVGTTLSGGLDSGSVTALAALEYKKQGKKLESFSSIPLFDVSNFPAKDKFGDESEFIHETANFSGNINLNFIKSENLSPLEGVKNYNSLFEEPLVSPTNTFWIHSLIQCVHSNNIDTLLIGQSGNATVSWHGFNEKFIEWAAFINSVKKHGIINMPAMLRNIKSHLIKPFVYSNLSKKEKADLDSLFYRIKNSAIKQEFAERLNFTKQMQYSNLYNSNANGASKQLKIIKPLYCGTSALWTELGRLHNIWISDPTADKRILEFCTSIPNNQFYKNGIEKYLFKQAMKGRMPDKVIHNTKRGRQAADLQQRILKHDLPEIKSILELLKKSEICNYYLDINKIASSISFLEENSTQAFYNTGSILLKGIAIGLFLQRFE